jgi:5-methylcytosine-specific restriction endonuclease McrA
MSNKKDIRAEFRKSVFKRDKHTCLVCGRKWTAEDADPALGRINAHHVIDRHYFENGGYVASNGVTVCEDTCHMKCERFHISGWKEWEPGLHPDDLYAKIGSSLSQAEADDKLLA